MRRPHVLVLSGFLALAGLSGAPLGCSGDGTGPTGDGDGDGDTGDGDGDQPGDGDGDGTGPIDVGCSSDSSCGAGQVCDFATGDCVSGQDCSQNPSICAFCADPGSQCNTGTAETYCDEEAGVCRRAKGTCDACDNDAECGDGANFPNKCLDGFCAEGCGACPPGFTCTSGGCTPVASAGQCLGSVICRNGETCPDGTQCTDLGVCLFLCDDDADCPAGKICSTDPGPNNQQCINGCIEGSTVQSGGDTLICHATGRYGYLCPAVPCDSGLECTAEGYCDVAGCQTSQDCPLVRTYCDTASGECVDGCEVDADCGAFELCDEGSCAPQGCRGKDVSCSLGQWCCGEELFEDAATCPATDLDGEPVVDGDCFFAPDPWCRTCEDNDDCADIDSFGQPSNCYELQQQDEQGNAVTLGKYCSVGCETNADCPRGLSCNELPTDQEGVTIKGCIDALCKALEDARAMAQ